MIRRLTGVVCLAFAALSASADPGSTYQLLVSTQIITSAQSQNGVATVVIGSQFYNGDFNSQQTFCASLLQYLQGLDSAAQGFTLVDGLGNTIGTFSGSSLTLN